MTLANSNIKTKVKKCKGTGKAKGFGCGEEIIPFDMNSYKFGLITGNHKCWLEWLGTKEGEKYLKSIGIKAEKKVKTKAKIELREKKKKLLTTSDLKKKLQPLVNKIARLIDTEKGCISCNHGWEGLPFRRKADGGHYTSVGSNESLRFNLFNIYKQCSICNTHLSGNEANYLKGLKRVYGESHAEYVNIELNKLYPLMQWSMMEIEFAIKEARTIIRDIESGKDYTRIEVNQRLKLYL